MDWDRCSLNLILYFCIASFTYIIWRKFDTFKRISLRELFFGHWTMSTATIILIIYGSVQSFCYGYVYIVTSGSRIANINISSMVIEIFKFITITVGLVAVRLQTNFYNDGYDEVL